MMFEWFFAWLLVMASLRQLKTIVVDGWAQLVHPEAPAPSLVNRQARAEFARKRAEARIELAQLQAAAGVPPGPGQAAADRLASWIATPRSGPSWIAAALNYLGLLLAEAVADARRKHAEKRREKHEGATGARATRTAGPYCLNCDLTPVDKLGDVCDSCTPVAKAQCKDCRAYVPADQLWDGGPCLDCRLRPMTPPPDADRPGPARLSLPGLPGRTP